MMQSDCLTGSNHLLLRNPFLAVYNVLPDSSLKYPCILQDHTELFMYIFPGNLADWCLIHEDLTAVQLIEPHKEIHHRCLTCAGGSDNCNLLPCLNFGGEVMNYSLIRSISEFYMPEFHIPFNIRKLLPLLAFIR